MRELLTPQFFDLMVFISLALGVILAGRRFVRDLRLPPPDDAPMDLHDTQPGRAEDHA